MAIEHYFASTDDTQTGRHRLDFGSEATRPAAAASVSGAFYWATDTGKIWMQDGTPAWIQIGATNIADMADAGGDPLTQYFLCDGTRQITDDVEVAATKLVDGVDLSLHAHTGAAGHGVQLAAAAFAADALSQATLATGAGATGQIGVATYQEWPTAALKATLTVLDTDSKVLVFASAIVGNSGSSNKNEYLAVREGVNAEQGEREGFNTSSSSRITVPVMHVFTSLAAGSHDFELRWKTGDTSNNYFFLNGIIIAIELKR